MMKKVAFGSLFVSLIAMTIGFLYVLERFGLVVAEPMLCVAGCVGYISMIPLKEKGKWQRYSQVGYVLGAFACLYTLTYDVFVDPGQLQRRSSAIRAEECLGIRPRLFIHG